jgi:phosphate transport system protein
MPKMSEHIVARFDDELRRLMTGVAEMGGIVEEQLASAVSALVRRDVEAAARVVVGDKRLDDLEAEIEGHIVSLLARRSPVARDLREVVATLKVIHNLERMGDFARNIAKRAQTLSGLEFVGPVRTIEAMGRIVGDMVHEIVEAYISQDVARAMLARERDAAVDGFHNSLFRELLTYMMESPQNITACTHLMFIAKNLERVGDHATNMAEALHFWITGDAVRGERDKADTTASLTAKS